MEALSPRKRYLKRHEALKQERQSWFDHWREVMEYVKPRRGRFLDGVSNVTNAGAKKNDKIINSTATIAQRVLSSGMHSSITSPARPWFQLGTPDPTLGKSGAAREWLHQVQEIMRDVFAKANLYKCLHEVYVDLGTPGTAVMHIDEDPEDLVRGYVFPIGQYCLANDERMSVSTMYRDTTLSVEQLVRKFGLEKCSRQVYDLYKRHELDQRIQVTHCIEPNAAVQPGKIGPAGMPWRSCWMEKDALDSEGFLGELGYHEKPFVAPRWDVNGEDVYGSSPGMDALADIKGMQKVEKDKLRAIEGIVKPPMTGPSSFAAQRLSLLPGDYNAADAMNAAQQLRPAVVIESRAVEVAERTVREHERRINQAYFADLWLALQQQDGRMTAREVVERHEEKMIQLGPVLERLQDELLDPIIDRVFGILLRGGHLPDPPEELAGVEMKVEYISILFQAQKLMGTTAVERLMGFAGNVYVVQPEILDKVDTDKVIDAYAEMLGTPPDFIRTEEQVTAIRAARAEAQQQAAAQEAAAQTAQSAQVLSQTDMQGDSALNRLLGSSGAPAGLKQ